MRALLGIACGYTSPLQGIARHAKTIHELGCLDVACADDRLFEAAIGAAREADATVLVIGLDQSVEAETVDRVGLLLPGRQQDLITKVAAASKGPTILVLMSGGPVDITFAKNDPRVVGIFWAGYPGQAGGVAIADILFGTANPGFFFKAKVSFFLKKVLSIFYFVSKISLLLILSKNFIFRSILFFS